jgi:ABC-type multidrug transport system ATPase subunit
LSKKEIWNFVEKIKKDKLIILTTHSMEEADYLSDKIIIMSNGEFKCEGSPLKLKSDFGDGYTISMILNEGKEDEITKRIQDIPNIKLESNRFGQMKFKYPSKLPLKSITEILTEFEKLAIIRDYNISQTSISHDFLFFSFARCVLICDK